MFFAKTHIHVCEGYRRFNDLFKMDLLNRTVSAKRWKTNYQPIGPLPFDLHCIKTTLGELKIVPNTVPRQRFAKLKTRSSMSFLRLERWLAALSVAG